MQLSHQESSHWRDDAAWVLARMQDRVSYSGWALAMVSGLALWGMMFRLVA